MEEKQNETDRLFREALGGLEIEPAESDREIIFDALNKKWLNVRLFYISLATAACFAFALFIFFLPQPGNPAGSKQVARLRKKIHFQTRREVTQGAGIEKQLLQPVAHSVHSFAEKTKPAFSSKPLPAEILPADSLPNLAGIQVPESVNEAKLITPASIEVLKEPDILQSPESQYHPKRQSKTSLLLAIISSKVKKERMRLIVTKKDSTAGKEYMFNLGFARILKVDDQQF